MRLLLVGSDRRIIRGLVLQLKNTYVTDTAHTQLDAIFMSESNTYDAILIDDDGKDIRGFDLCRNIREIGVHFLIALFTEKTDECSRIRGLNSGADVVIYKPIVPEEVVAQISVLARRGINIKNCSNIIKIGDVCLDMKDRTVCVGDTPVSLRRREFDLLEYLFINRGKTVSKEDLLEHVWEKGLYLFSNTVEVHVRSIRQKFMEEAGFKIIKTSRGFGYKIEPCEIGAKPLLSRR